MVCPNMNKHLFELFIHRYLANESEKKLRVMVHIDT